MRLAFVDLETTGGSPTGDRITEVGIIAVDVDEREPCRPIEPVREWSTLVNPETPIPAYIQALTGITDAMVADAPRFDDLADEVVERLDGRLFVAHNARFDHGFLRNAYRRLGRSFRPDVLCTVRLSRKLYPGYARHSLDALIERHRLSAEMRHRALGDARLLWQLWQRLHDALPVDDIAKAVDRLTARPTLPRHLDPEVLERLPNTAGVYLFFGAARDEDTATEMAKAPPPLVADLSTLQVDGPSPVGAPDVHRRTNAENDPALPREGRLLYVGKAKNLRQRVLAHFSGDHLSPREMEISQQLNRIEWIETGGGTSEDLGALIVEATLVKRLQPEYNRQLRRSDDVCAWRLVVDRARGRWRLALARPDDDLLFAQDPDLYGPFASPREARVALRAIADAHGLCHALLRLEKVATGKPCFSHQVKRCHGACVGVETEAEHTERLLAALASLAVRPWPHPGPVAIREGRAAHWIGDWAYLGTEESPSSIGESPGREAANDEPRESPRRESANDGPRESPHRESANDAREHVDAAPERQAERPPPHIARRAPFDHDVYRLLTRRLGQKNSS